MPVLPDVEERHGPAVDELVARSGLTTLVYHPLGILDRLSTTRYSTRLGSFRVRIRRRPGTRALATYCM